MILNGRKLKNTLFSDSRGHFGEWGQLHISEASNGIKYLVKSKPTDVVNEFVVHRLARIIGVPTSDAVLIDNRGFIEVGIEYEKDFKRVLLNDFVDNAKYPNDSPFLADLFSYLALRDLVAMGDNHQLALSRNRLISFDCAESFCLSDTFYGAMCRLNSITYPLMCFSNGLKLNKEFISVLRFLKRPKTNFIVDAYLDIIFGFVDVDLAPMLDELKEVFPVVVSDFYEACFGAIRKTIIALPTNS